MHCIVSTAIFNFQAASGVPVDLSTWDQVLENGLKLGHGPQQRISMRLICTRMEEHRAYLGLKVRDRLTYVGRSTRFGRHWFHRWSDYPNHWLEKVAQEVTVTVFFTILWSGTSQYHDLHWQRRIQYRTKATNTTWLPSKSIVIWIQLVGFEAIFTCLRFLIFAGGENNAW